VPSIYRNYGPLGLLENQRQLVEHKELRPLLDAMIRAAKLSFEKTGNLLPFAIALNDQGKIRQLAFPERSAEETGRFLEVGLELIAQQTTCKAVGFCSEIRLNGFAVMHVVFMPEHRDRCAYRVVVPDLLDARQWDARCTESRFFQRMNSFSASTRW
jgi:hypothetical protein